jgi:hypothetical protein
MLSINGRNMSPGFSCFLILVLLTIDFFVGKRCMQGYLMMSQGISVFGTVSSAHYHTHVRGGSSGYRIDYDFTYNGVSYHGKSDAPDEWVQKTAMPSPIRVQFLPDDPTINWPPDIGTGNPLWGIVFAEFVLVALTVFLAIKTILDLRASSKHETNP